MPLAKVLLFTPKKRVVRAHKKGPPKIHAALGQFDFYDGTLNNRVNKEGIRQAVTFDVPGFSRGAATARYIIHSHF